MYDEIELDRIFSRLEGEKKVIKTSHIGKKRRLENTSNNKDTFLTGFKKKRLNIDDLDWYKDEGLYREEPKKEFKKKGRDILNDPTYQDAFDGKFFNNVSFTFSFILFIYYM